MGSRVVGIKGWWGLGGGVKVWWGLMGGGVKGMVGV